MVLNLVFCFCLPLCFVESYIMCLCLLFMVRYIVSNFRSSLIGMVGMITKLCIALLVNLTYIQTIYFIISVASIAQSEMCLTTDTDLTADPGFASLTSIQSNTFVEIDNDIMNNLFCSADSKRVLVSQRNYVHKALVNRLFKLAKKKMW